jgi:hypothetical protein
MHQAQEEAQAQIDALKQQIADLKAELATYHECDDSNGCKDVNEEFHVKLRNPNPDDPFDLFVALPNIHRVARAVCHKDCE